MPSFRDILLFGQKRAFAKEKREQDLSLAEDQRKEDVAFRRRQQSARELKEGTVKAREIEAGRQFFNETFTPEEQAAVIVDPVLSKQAGSIAEQGGGRKGLIDWRSFLKDAKRKRAELEAKQEEFEAKQEERKQRGLIPVLFEADPRGFVEAPPGRKIVGQVGRKRIERPVKDTAAADAQKLATAKQKNLSAIFEDINKLEKVKLGKDPETGEPTKLTPIEEVFLRSLKKRAAKILKAADPTVNEPKISTLSEIDKKIEDATRRRKKSGLSGLPAL